MEKLIEVKGLKKYFLSGIFHKLCVKAVDGVSFKVRKGETLGLVGESGCGKTTVGRCVLRLIKPTSGEVRFKGEDILALNRKRLRTLRKKMQIIFQDVDGSLNPRMRISDLLTEPLRVHCLLNGKKTEEALRLLKLVNLTPDLLIRFPHELSGGQRQRIGIARAMALNPEFIVLDEPAASLDISVQAQIFELMKKFQEELGISYLLISHNLRIVKLMAHRITVMYLGKFVEVGEVGEIFDEPAHPYTQALLSAVYCSMSKSKKVVLRGDPPISPNPLVGCRFHPRCHKARNICREVEPELQERGDSHLVACHFA